MIDIEELIPQRAPIVMVDDFLGMKDDISYTSLTVREDNVFATGGFLTECGVIEHIAQSAAARNGYIFRKNNEKVPIGYIGSVNNFTISRLPRVGEILHTSIKVLMDVMNITLIEAESSVENEKIAGCRMKIFLDK